VPLLERLKFAAIAASNLDEFFMVRVAALRQAVDEGDTAPDLAGCTPTQQLSAIDGRAHAFVAELYRLMNDELLAALAAFGVRLLAVADLTDAQRGSVSAFFTTAVLPVLTPLAIDIDRPFPLLSSLSLNLAVRLEPEPGETKDRLGIVQIPTGVARLSRIAGDEGATDFLLLDDIIRAHLPLLFSDQRILEASVIRVGLEFLVF